MYKCQDCAIEMEIDPDDFDIDDHLYCDNCGADHLVTAIDDDDLGIRYELIEEDK